MKYPILTALFLAAALTAGAQAPANTAPTKPKGTAVTPAQIDVNGTKVSGDVVVVADLTDLLTIIDQYKTEEKALQDRLAPGWQKAQTKIQADIAAVKKANGWGDDVVFDPDSKTWIKQDKQDKPAEAKKPAETKK